jgi:hypothetical protein
MAKGILFSAQSSKTAKSFVEAVRKNASQFGFGVRDVFNLAKMYQDQGVEVAGDFQAYSIVLCNFERSYTSMRSNPRRAAVLLQPKQIVVHDGGNGLTVDYLPFTRPFIVNALPGDEAFAGSLHESCQKIVSLINACI